jgi:hypothetical protein
MLTNVPVELDIPLPEDFDTPSEEPLFADDYFDHSHADGNLELQSDDAYLFALQNDVVAKTRTLVIKLRDSGQRRAAWKNFVVTKRAEKVVPDHVRPLQLLRDMVVRWSSTYFMIKRVLDVRPVSFMCRFDPFDLI